MIQPAPRSQKMNAIPRILIVIIVVAITCTPAFSVSPTQQKRTKESKMQTIKRRLPMSVAEAIESVRHSIVQIVVKLEPSQMQQPGNPIRPIGSGFLISSDGYVITARHVINLGPSIPINQMRVSLPLPIIDSKTFSMRGGFTGVAFEVVEQDEQHDLALLKLQRNPFKNQVSPGIHVAGEDIKLIVSVPILNQERPKDGTQIAVSGYPLGETVLITNVGYIASSWATNIVNVPIPNAPPGFQRIDIADVYYADIQMNHGNSGGPVYSIETGDIIGVAVAVRLTEIELEGGGSITTPDNRKLLYNAGIGLVVPMRYVLDLTRKHGVSVRE